MLTTSHKSKNHTALYLAVGFVLLMLSLNKIRCIILKHIFIPKWRLKVDFSIALWWWATTFCWKWQVGHGMKKVGNHCFKTSSIKCVYFWHFFFWIIPFRFKLANGKSTFIELRSFKSLFLVNFQVSTLNESRHLLEKISCKSVSENLDAFSARSGVCYF